MNKIKRKIKELFIYFLRKIEIKSIYSIYLFFYGLSQSLLFLDKRITGSGNEIGAYVAMLARTKELMFSLVCTHCELHLFLFPLLVKTRRYFRT